MIHIQKVFSKELLLKLPTYTQYNVKGISMNIKQVTQYQQITQPQSKFVN